MDELTQRQLSVIEAVLIALGVLACVVYAWHDGELLTPSYILYGMGVAAGWMGFAHKLARNDNGGVEWCWVGALILSLLPMLWGTLGALHGHVVSAFLFLTAYGIMAVGLAGSRYIQRRRERRWDG